MRAVLFLSLLVLLTSSVRAQAVALDFDDGAQLFQLNTTSDPALLLRLQQHQASCATTAQPTRVACDCS